MPKQNKEENTFLGKAASELDLHYFLWRINATVVVKGLR